MANNVHKLPSSMLLLAAAIIVFTGCAHSYLGERYLLVRLFQRGNLHKLLGSTDFTKGTLRFAWHITTLAWLAFAVILVMAHSGSLSVRAVLYVIAGAAILSAALPIFFTRGKHLSRLAFLVVAGLIVFAA